MVCRSENKKIIELCYKKIPFQSFCFKISQFNALLAVSLSLFGKFTSISRVQIVIKKILHNWVFFSVLSVNRPHSSQRLVRSRPSVLVIHNLFLSPLQGLWVLLYPTPKVQVSPDWSEIRDAATGEPSYMIPCPQAMKSEPSFGGARGVKG